MRIAEEVWTLRERRVVTCMVCLVDVFNGPERSDYLMSLLPWRLGLHIRYFITGWARKKTMTLDDNLGGEGVMKWKSPPPPLELNLVIRQLMLPTHSERTVLCSKVSRLGPFAPLVEWYRGKSKSWKINLSQCHSVRHISHMDWPGVKSGAPRRQTDD